METTSDQYLRGQYREDKYELQKVSKLIDILAPVFGRCFDTEEKGWPYELQRNQAWTRRKYSHSTNAMVLSALALYTGRLGESVLAPVVRPRAGVRPLEQLATAVEQGWEQLAMQSMSSIESSSFGNCDPFTLTWLVELLGSDLPAVPTPLNWIAVEKCVREAAAARVKESYEKPAEPVLSRTLKRRDIPEHAFPLVRVILLAKALKQDLAGATEVRRYFFGRLHAQLSANEVRDSNYYDPAEVVFALEGILQIDPGAVDAALLDRVFSVLAGNPQRPPFWRPTKPFVSDVQGSALLPLSVEVANSLIRSCILLDTRDGRATRFTRHLGLFRRYLDWLFSRVVRGTAKDPTDPNKPVEFTGWHSEHVDLPDRVHTWQTSQVLTFLLNYEVMLQRHIGFRSLEEVGLSIDYRYTRSREATEQKLRRKGKLKNSGLTASGYWEEEGDSKEPLFGLKEANSRYRVYGQVCRRFVVPRESATGTPAWSMLLYGPPGTGKTGIAETLAGALGFPLITVTPSDFIRRGEAEVEARAQDIFDTLGEQTDVVVLLDEIDRLILDRDSNDYSRQGDFFQLMTPSMLPKLKRLRDRERVIFVIGTNYADRIDPAAKRPGRIDQRFLVLPPDLEQRNRIIRSCLKREAETIWGEGSKWDTVAAGIDEANVAELAKRTVLAVYTELAQWIRGVVQDLPNAATDHSKATLLKRLEEGYADLPPGTVRLLSYAPRFRQAQEGSGSAKAKNADKESVAADETVEEFLLLLYLKLEAEQPLKKEEKELAKQVVGRFVGPEMFGKLVADGGPAEADKTTVRNNLLAKVNESKVVELLLGSAKEWLAD
jgi:hypothetical protein